jgi:hypothetical protein
MSASSLGDPQSLNLYAYCGNDPINHTDPDGLDGGTSITLVVVIQVISAIFSALRALFGGKQRVAVKVQGRFFRETASISVWLEPSVRSGVGAVAIQANKEDKKRRPKLKQKQKQKKTDADIKRDREAQTEVDDYDPESVRESAIALAGLAGGTYMVVEYLINQYNESGVDDRIIKCQVAQESKFNPTATGRNNDIGLLQVLPATGKQLGFTAKSLYDPAINIIAGTRYLKYLIGRFGSVRAGLVAYNGGEGNVAVLGEDARSLFKSRQYADRILACANQIKPIPSYRKR